MKNVTMFFAVFNFLLFCCSTIPLFGMFESIKNGALNEIIAYKVPSNFFKTSAKHHDPSIVNQSPESSVPSMSTAKQDYQQIDPQLLSFKTFTDWDKACSALPLYKDGGSMKRDSAFKVAKLTHAKALLEFNQVLEFWLEMKKNHILMNQKDWSMSNLGNAMPEVSSFNSSFIPFAQKLLLKPDDECIIRGDLHGDIHSLMAQLRDLKVKNIIDDNFKIIPENVWMLFLGDYVDRGQYGCEVIYTLLRLSLANPDRVILVRGNHEDEKVNAMLAPNYFSEELRYKFSDVEFANVEYRYDDPTRKVYEMYNFLPVVLYVGCQDSTKQDATKAEIDGQSYVNWVQCCHGGIELGYDPLPFLNDRATKYQLLGSLNRKKFLNLMESCCKVGISNSETAQKKEWFLRFQAALEKFIKDPGLAMYSSENLQLKMPVNGRLVSDFLWGDFEIDPNQIDLYFSERSLCLSKFATAMILKLKSDKQNNLAEVIRAHQHSEETLPLILDSCGVCKWWNQPEKEPIRSVDDALVLTFNVAPDTGFGKVYDYGYDTFAILKMQEQFKDWTLRVINQQIYPTSQKTPA